MKIYKVNIIVLFIAAFSSELSAQSDTIISLKAKNILNLSIGGESVAALNYERILFIKQQNLWGFRVGMFYYWERFCDFPTGKEVFHNYSIPLDIFYIRSSKNLKKGFEIALGHTVFRGESWDSTEPFQSGQSYYDNLFAYQSIQNVIYLRLAYRRIRPQGGFFYKLGLNPLTYIYRIKYKGQVEGYRGLSKTGFYIPLPHFAVGWAF